MIISRLCENLYDLTKINYKYILCTISWQKFFFFFNRSIILLYYFTTRILKFGYSIDHHAPPTCEPQWWQQQSSLRTTGFSSSGNRFEKPLILLSIFSIILVIIYIYIDDERPFLISIGFRLIITSRVVPPDHRRINTIVFNIISFVYVYQIIYQIYRSSANSLGLVGARRLSPNIIDYWLLFLCILCN